MTVSGYLEFLIFFLLASTIWAFANFYLSFRVLSAFYVTGRTRSIFITLYLIMSFSYVYGQLLSKMGLWEGVGAGLTIFGGYVLGGVSITLSFFIPLDFGVVVKRSVMRWLTGAGSGRPWPAYLLQPLSPPTCAGLLVVCFSAVGMALHQGHAPPVVTELEFQADPKAGLEREVTIAHLTDLHIGHTVGEEELAAVIAQTNALEPDVIVITGDFFDRSAGDIASVATMLADLKAPLGVFGVTGNHEVYAGLDASVRSLRKAGIRLLRQEAVRLLPGLYLAGVDDKQAINTQGKISSDDAVPLALKGVPREAFTVLLTHRPEPARQASALAADLVLAGHTHGGQIPPFQLLTPISNGGFLHGLYEVGATHLYVSAGTGTWGPPMRLFSRSEIVLIRIVPGSVP